jgi:hypothetical protein
MHVHPNNSLSGNDGIQTSKPYTKQADSGVSLFKYLTNRNSTLIEGEKPVRRYGVQKNRYSMPDKW